MALKNSMQSRRDFLKVSAGIAGGIGVLAFPAGLDRVFADVSPGVQRLTDAYPEVLVGNTSQLVEGEPLDFRYPLEEQFNFVVKLGVPATGGVGPSGDIVAFSYLCSHMGCPLTGLYNKEHKMLGPCPCHYSRFDLSKGGLLILGQATQSLPQIVLETRGNDIFATGVTGLVYGHANNLEGGLAVHS
jgi:arsenite oxidase small subunit